MKAHVDFDCLEDGCGHTVEFDLMSLRDSKGLLSCPKCRRQYQFAKPFLDKLEQLKQLCITVRECEPILGDCSIAVATPAGEVKVPYRLLLTRLNTLISLDVNGESVDFNFRIEPLDSQVR